MDEDELYDHLEAYTADVDAAAGDLVAECVGAARAFLTGVLPRLVTRWVRTFGSLDATLAPAEATTATLFVGVALAGLPGLVPPKRSDWAKLHRLGVDLVVATTDRPGVAGRDVLLSDPVLDDPTAAFAAYRSWRAGAKPRVTSWGEAAARVGAENLRINRVASTIDTAARTAAADGQETAAAGLDLSRVWISERDGCVHCLGLAGAVVAAGGDFDATATFGDRPLGTYKDRALSAPPRHPNCRCTVAYGTPDRLAPLAAGLVREAERSIVRGFSLPSEGEGVRIRAADRVLTAGTGLPKSVQAYGRRAVREGEFPRGRDVPGPGTTPVLLRPTT